MPYFTDRLILRKLTTEDAEDLWRIYGDPATNAFNPAGPYPSPEFASLRLREWIKEYEQHGYGNRAVALRDEPERIIGFAGICVRTLNGALTNNLGYRFSTDVWGKGIATEFCRFALSHGFQSLGLQEITAVVRPDHLASQRVLIKAGMGLTGIIDDVPGSAPSQVYKLNIKEWHAWQKETADDHPT